jgi:hypothetical protein
MMTQSALFAVLSPAVPEGEARPLTPDQSTALLTATESFLGVMSQVRCNGFPNPSGKAKTADSNASLAETPKSPANPLGKAGDIDASMSSTLMAMMAQPRIAARESHKSASTQAANFKNAPAGQGGGARPITETSNNDASPTQTPKSPANPPSKTLRIAAGESHKSGSTQAANFKNAPVGQGGGARPMTETSNNDASLTQTPKPPANPSGKALRIAAGESHKSGSTQAANFKNAPVGQGSGAKPLTETSNNDASPTQTLKPVVDPPVKAADIDASATSTLMAMAAQPQIAAGEFRKAESTQAVNLKIAPAIQEGQATPLRETPDSDASPTETPEPSAQPSDKAADMDASVSSKLTVMADQPQIAAGEFRKPASTQHDEAPVVLSSSSNSKSESTGPVPRTMDSRPAETSASTTEPAAHWAEPAGSSQQPVGAQIAITPPVVFVSAGSVDGTGGAWSNQQMKFGTDQNEIAGPTAQKVPTTSLKSDLATKSANDLMVESDSDHSGHTQDSIDSALVMDWPAKASEGNVDAGKGTGAAQSVDHSATQAERVGHLVSQQVVMIRQSGANNLAVSLKLDPHTELSLQLTNHNGQVEASVRWERGAVAGLENHWKDLQESLARQNVLLLPLENRASPRTPASHSASDTVSASPFNQSSQNPQRHSREAQRDLPPATTTVKTVPVTNKATTRTASRQGWESWA